MVVEAFFTSVVLAVEMFVFFNTGSLQWPCSLKDLNYPLVSRQVLTQSSIDIIQLSDRRHHKHPHHHHEHNTNTDNISVIIAHHHRQYYCNHTLTSQHQHHKYYRNSCHNHNHHRHYHNSTTVITSIQPTSHISPVRNNTAFVFLAALSPQIPPPSQSPLSSSPPPSQSPLSSSPPPSPAIRWEHRLMLQPIKYS